MRRLLVLVAALAATHVAAVPAGAARSAAAAPSTTPSVTETLLPVLGAYGMAVDPVARRVYVTSPSSGRLVVLDEDGQVLDVIGGLDGASGMVVLGRTLWISLSHAGGLAAFDLDLRLVTDVVGEDVLFSPQLEYSGGRLWTASGTCDGWTTLASVDPATSDVDVLDHGAYCLAMAADEPVAPGTLVTWEANRSPTTVTRWDTTTWPPTPVVEQRADAYRTVADLAFDPGGETVEVATGSVYAVVQVGLDDLTPTGTTYPAPDGMDAVAVTGRAGGLVAGAWSSRDRAIELFRTGSPGAHLASWDVAGDHDSWVLDRALAFDASGSRLFAVLEEPGIEQPVRFLSYRLVPTVDRVSPRSGPAGTAVTVRGEGFLAATRVRFGTVRASEVTVRSDTELVAVVPPGVTGEVAVRVGSVVGFSRPTGGARFVAG